MVARNLRFMPVILLIQKVEITSKAIRSQLKRVVVTTYLKNTQNKTGQMEWLKR
jgi:hypothetical protein